MTAAALPELPTVHLRPLITEDVDALTANRGEDADPFNWFGFTVAGGLAASVAEGRTLNEDSGSLAVTSRADELLGDVSWHRVVTGPGAACFCWNIGISLLPRERGKGYGAAAQRALARYLFDTTLAQRIEADTDVDNVAEQRSLEKAGFTREGVLRARQFQRGEWRDHVVYSVVRGEL